MHIRSIIPLTHNAFHNAFTGAAWFKGDLYVAYRQGDGHVCNQGRLVVMRSRNKGKTFDIVAVFKGQFDTRDAHLYTSDDQRLFVTGFELERKPAMTRHSGVAWTDDGSHWSGWTRRTGCQNDVLWRSRFHGGKHYCAGYRLLPGNIDRHEVWYESDDGVAWREKMLLHTAKDRCSEAALWFSDNGDVKVLLRREHESKRPLLYQASPPYEKWSSREVPIALHGPCIWDIAGTTFIAGRWYPNPLTAQTALTAIFRLDVTQPELSPELETVLPSGPGFDHSYIGPAICPDDPYRIKLSYYSPHASEGQPGILQQNLPDIYLVDAVIDAPWQLAWDISPCQPGQTLEALQIADQAGDEPAWTQSQAIDSRRPSTAGYMSIDDQRRKTDGVVWLRTMVHAGQAGKATLRIGADGPIRAWLNGALVLPHAEPHPPAVPDQIELPVELKQGQNPLMVAIKTGARSTGVFARCH